MQDTPTLLLVDGSSYLYRAFHAMPDLRVDRNDPNSQATGAIRGMVNMLQSLRREYPTHHAVCVFDAKGPTFRDDIYPPTKPRAHPCPTICAAKSSPSTAWCGSWVGRS
jgi:DNA polymerase I